MSTNRMRRTAVLTAAMALSGLTALGALPASAVTTESANDTFTRAAPDRTAPNCITDREDKGKIYTTVWVTNECKRYYRVKLIMARGADSRCFSLRPGQTRKSKSRGVSPYLERVVLC
ncbi:hypothetical protein CDG81_18090 [Actinopolyspora erythraea]|uniref:Uncharacterized protein n=1 Tax=Actinopolyspora erythraea TaxID=414996 RepID=A0A099D1E3_9ACTN|nr:hypothetical protein [Actinopolyspora erythraea]ASU79856.1 hypothetical protein CDG81_18090 [Actinopolyspora erythraea]KGI79627.1 hypothetical protein IL38_21960 [Actinopolyspora erythraea]